MRPLFRTVSGICCACLCAPLHAQTNSPTDKDPSGQEIVVTARKQSEKLKDIPDTIQAFSAQTLERSGIRSINDLTTLVPGFHVIEAQQPGVELINVRGIGQQRGGEPPIAVVIDGVQQISPSQLTQNLFDIQQIEFLKGPQGALYGRNAMGGAINIVTQPPGNHLTGSGEVSFAEGNDVDVKGYISTPITDDVSFRIAADYRHRDGQIDDVTLDQKVDFDRTLDVRSSLLIKPTSNLKIDITGSYLDQRAGAAPYVPGPPNASRDPVYSNILGVGTRKLGDASVKIDYDLGSVTLTSVSAFSSVRSKIHEDLDYTPADLLSANQNVQTDAESEEIRLSSSNPDARLRWVAGFYYLHTWQASQTQLFADPGYTGLLAPLAISSLSSVDHNNAYAVFGQGIYRITPQINFTVALRYDIDQRHETDLLPPTPSAQTQFHATFRSLQPKFSLDYHVTPDTMLYATIAKGFRSGGFNTNDFVTREYKKEEDWNYEAGVKTSLFGRKLQLNGAFFYTPITDRQVYGLDIPAGAVQFIANPIPKSHVIGAELEAMANPVTDMQLNFGITWLHTRIDSYDTTVFAGTGLSGNYQGNALDLTPSLSVDAAAQYTFHWSESKITPRVSVTGSAGDYYWEIDNVDKRTPVWLANAQITWEISQFEVTIFANNFLNRHYDEEFVPAAWSGNILGEGIGAMGSPRQIGGRVKVRF